MSAPRTAPPTPTGSPRASPRNPGAVVASPAAAPTPSSLPPATPAATPALPDAARVIGTGAASPRKAFEYKETRLVKAPRAGTGYVPTDEVINYDSSFQSRTGYQDSQYKACKRFMADCRHQKAIFLMHAVGSGKTITSLCMAFNVDPTIKTTIMTIRGLQSAFNEEYNKMVTYYGPPTAQDVFNDMRAIFFDEFAAKLAAMAEMRRHELGREVADLFANRLLIIDEAHKLLKILETDVTGRIEKMMLYVFNSCAKIVFLSATPIQRDWSDFAKMLKMISKINDPSKLGTLRSYDEFSFKKDFWFPQDKNPGWWIKDVIYSTIFIKLKEYAEKIKSVKVNYIDTLVSLKSKIPGIFQTIMNCLGSVGDILFKAAPAAAPGAAVAAGAGFLVGNGSFSQFWNELPGPARAALKGLGIVGTAAFLLWLSWPSIVAGAAWVGGSALVSWVGAAATSATAVSGAAKIAAIYGFIELYANYIGTIKSFVDSISTDVYPCDITEITRLFSPFMSFVDYKATEMFHFSKMEEIEKAIGKGTIVYGPAVAAAPVAAAAAPVAAAAAPAPAPAPAPAAQALSPAGAKVSGDGPKPTPYPPKEWKPSDGFDGSEAWNTIPADWYKDGTPQKEALAQMRVKRGKIMRGSKNSRDLSGFVKAWEFVRPNIYPDPVAASAAAAAVVPKEKGWWPFGSSGGGSPELARIPEDNDELKKLISYERILSRFPNLHIIREAVKLSSEQQVMRYKHFSKGYIPSMDELYSVGRITGEYDPFAHTFVYLDSTFVPQSDKLKFQTALRSVGNYSIDVLRFATLSVEDYLLINQATIDAGRRARLTAFQTNGQYIAAPFNEHEMKQVHGNSNNHGTKLYNALNKEILEKEKELVATFTSPLPKDLYISMPKYKTFACPKFDKALEMITQARKKFAYLPVVYSNFNLEGMQRFSAYLTELDLPHYVLSPEKFLDDPTFVNRETQKPYMRWLCGHDEIHTGILKRKLISSGMGAPSVAAIYKYAQKAIKDQPCCIIVHPTLQEGLSLTKNEVMICLEPMAGYGQQEQVYGRVVRSYGNEDKFITRATYDILDNIDTKTGFQIAKGGMAADAVAAAYAAAKVKANELLEAQAVALEFTTHRAAYYEFSAKVASKVKDFLKTSRYSHSYFNENNIEGRPAKYLVQLYSTSIPQLAREDEMLKIELRKKVKTLVLSQFEDDLTPEQLKWIEEKIPESFGTPLYQTEKMKALIESAPDEESKRILGICLVRLIPRISIGLNFYTFMPLIMLDALIQESSIIWSSRKVDNPNPQRWSEVAGKGVVDSDGFITSDQFWMAKNLGQECEFNELRRQLSTMEDDNIEGLYPKDDISPHFKGERYACSSDGTESKIYYPTGTDDKKCIIKTKETRASPGTCDRIGPHVLEALPGGGKRRRTFKKHRGGVEQTATTTNRGQTRSNTPIKVLHGKVHGFGEEKQYFTGVGQKVGILPGVKPPTAPEVRALPVASVQTVETATPVVATTIGDESDTLIRDWYDLYPPCTASEGCDYVVEIAAMLKAIREMLGGKTDAEAWEIIKTQADGPNMDMIIESANLELAKVDVRIEKNTATGFFDEL